MAFFGLLNENPYGTGVLLVPLCFESLYCRVDGTLHRVFTDDISKRRKIAVYLGIQMQAVFQEMFDCILVYGCILEVKATSEESFFFTENDAVVGEVQSF